jgi:DNA invertase Pin-like site-specific DNA recombinase
VDADKRKPGTTKNKPDRAVELREKGLTAEEIATALGTREQTVWRYLNRPDRHCLSGSWEDGVLDPIGDHEELFTP